MLMANSTVESPQPDIRVMERQGNAHSCRAVPRLGPLLHQLLRNSSSRKSQCLLVLRPHRLVSSVSVKDSNNQLVQCIHTTTSQGMSQPFVHSQDWYQPLTPHGPGPPSLPPRHPPLSRTLSGAALRDSQGLSETHLHCAIIPCSPT